MKKLLCLIPFLLLGCEKDEPQLTQQTSTITPVKAGKITMYEKPKNGLVKITSFEYQTENYVYTEGSKEFRGFSFTEKDTPNVKMEFFIKGVDLSNVSLPISYNFGLDNKNPHFNIWYVPSTPIAHAIDTPFTSLHYFPKKARINQVILKSRNNDKLSGKFINGEIKVNLQCQNGGTDCHKTWMFDSVVFDIPFIKM